MQLIDLPQEVLSKVFEELPLERLTPFLQSRYTYREAYRLFHSRKSVKIEIGLPSFHEDHYDFGMYAQEENDADYYSGSLSELKGAAKRTILKRISIIYFEADLENIDFAISVVRLAEILKLSAPKVIQMHTLVGSQGSLELLLIQIQRLCAIPTLKVALKIEIDPSLVPILFRKIGTIPLHSINIFVQSIGKPLVYGSILLNLHRSTQMFKLKSICSVMNLFILGESLLWLDIDMPMSESMGFLQTLSEYSNLTELRLFQIDNSFDNAYFFDLLYPPTLKRLYLHFENEANVLNVAKIHRGNPHIEYLYISDNKSTSTYRK